MSYSSWCVVAGILIACLESQAQSGRAPTLRVLGKLPDAPDALCSFKFSSGQEGWAWEAGGRYLWTTEDGGSSWTRVALPAAVKSGDWVEWVSPISAKSARVVTDGGFTVFETGDRGANWTVIKAPVPQERFAGLQFDGARGWAAIGSDYNSVRGFLHQEIYLTTDGARSWQRAWRGETAWNGKSQTVVGGFQFADADNGVAFGELGVLKTSDGGRTWTRVPYQFSDAGGDQSDLIAQVFFVSPLRGWVLKQNGSIFRTEDGGRIWVRIVKGARSPAIEGGTWTCQLWFDSASRGWLIGSNGKLVETEDGGNHWLQVEGAKKGTEFVNLSCSRNFGCRFSDFDRNLYGVDPP